MAWLYTYSLAWTKTSRHTLKSRGDEMSDKLCYTVREACNSLSIGRSTFYELVRAGHLQLIKLGAKSLVSRDELVRFIASRTGEAPAR